MVKYLTVGELKDIIKDVPNDFKIISSDGDYGYKYIEYCEIAEESKEIFIDGGC